MSSILLWALALVVATVAAAAVVRNPIIRRRLRFSLIALLALVALHTAAHHTPPYLYFGQEDAIERLMLALALINAVVTLAFNPWFEQRVSDRSPAIVQDTLVLIVFGAAAVFLLKDATFLTASAIAAAAVGFALQDTLSNAIAGLAIQIDKPFRVGQWVSVASYEGAIAEVTWRATKIRTKSGNLVIVPNNVIAKEVINNFSEPALPARYSVDVGAAYGVPPNEVRDAILTAMRQVPRLLRAPAPDVLLADFGASAIVYRARFWLDDFTAVDTVQTELRTAIYYEFRRRNIEIPWPIQIEYERHETVPEEAEVREGYLRTIASSPVLAHLPQECLAALAAAAEQRLYGNGENIVREGEPGSSMFLVRSGRVSIAVGPDAHEVAVTESGGYFGEMSLLTGEPRSATVRAKGDCTVLEIRADAFASYITSHPEIVDELAEAAARRRRELEASRSDRTSVTVEPISLAQRIRKFFGVSDSAVRHGSRSRTLQ